LWGELDAAEVEVHRMQHDAAGRLADVNNNVCPPAHLPTDAGDKLLGTMYDSIMHLTSIVSSNNGWHGSSPPFTWAGENDTSNVRL
jgi:hypothetical protein